MGRPGTLVALYGLVLLSPGARGEPPAAEALPAVEAPSFTAAPAAAEPSPVPAAAPAPRPAAPAPAPARKYLEAGARLFNKGRYEQASKYLKAAELDRDRLTESERVVLGVYREKVDEQLKRLSAPAPVPAQAPPRPTDPAGPTAAAPADLATSVLPEPFQAPALPEGAAVPVPDGLTGLGPRPGLAPPRGGTPGTLRGTESWRDTADSKQKARWLLHLAREHGGRGNYAAAEAVLAEARSIPVAWGYFDDTPDKVAAALAEARTRKAASSNDPSVARASRTAQDARPFDRRTARARLREARAALSAGEFDQAGSIATEVKGWGVSFYPFDDTPDKVLAALDAARRKAGSAPAPPRPE